MNINIGKYDVPFVHIVLEKKCELSKEEVINRVHFICKEELPNNSIPQGYKIIEAFPIKSSGKRDMELIKLDKKNFMVPTEKTIKIVDFE